MESGLPISEMNNTDPSKSIEKYGINSMNNILGGTCVPGHWVSPLYMTVFMLLANVLLMNSMVACCTLVLSLLSPRSSIYLLSQYLAELFTKEELITVERYGYSRDLNM